jgi:kynurenine formamidase
MLACAVVFGACGRAPDASSPPLDLTRLTLVDLTHAYNAETICWPTDTSRFRLRELARGPTPGGWFYAANAFTSPEHGGTHLDAPIHFQIEGRTTESIPLAQLVAPAVMIDVSAQAGADPDDLLTVDDVRAFEAEHGAIAAGTIKIEGGSGGPVRAIAFVPR